ncbi:MAG: hypothetical protein ABIO44_03010, partial [Saprospiraceae bacterium]
NPNINLIDSLFEVIEPNSNNPVKISENPLITKSQSFEFLLSPKQSGSFSLVPSFCYFNPETKKYVQLVDSLQINIKPNFIASQSTEDKLLPIHTSLDSGNTNLYHQFWAWIIILFPGLFALFLFRQKRESKIESSKSSWVKRIFSPSSKSHQSINESSLDLDNIIVNKSKSLFAELNSADHIFQVKEFLLSRKNSSSSAIALLNLMNELEILKYNPLSKEQDYKNLVNRINNL